MTRLHRLISYLHHTRDYIQFCFAGDNIQNCFIIMYVDAGLPETWETAKVQVGPLYTLSALTPASPSPGHAKSKAQ